jgi:DNA-binding winged helix-turn-helix (wHTH) protein
MYLTSKRIYEFGEFRLKVSARLLERDGRLVPLGSKAFEVLTCLVSDAGQVVTKDVLLKTVWPESFVADANLSQHIFALRKALGDRSTFIVTVPGRGYQFTGQVREVMEQPAAAASGHSSFILQRTMERTRIVIEQTTQIEAVAECLRGQPLSVDAQRLQILAGQYASAADRALPRPPGEETPATAMHQVSIRVGDVPHSVAPSRKAVAQWSSRRSSLLEYMNRHVAVWIAGTVAVFLLLAGRFTPRPHASALTTNRTVVIADFENRTGDSEFDVALRRALEIDLDQSPYLDVMSEPEATGTPRLLGQTSEIAFFPATARAICQRSNPQVLITGSVASVGQLYLLTLEATDCESGRILAGTKAAVANKEQVLDSIDAASMRLRRALGESEASVERFQSPSALR